MGRLEAVEIRLEKIDKQLFRLESDFFSKKYLKLEHVISNFSTIGVYAKQIDCGPFGSNLLDTTYRDNGVLVIRPFNLKNGVVEDDNLVYVDRDTLRINNLKCYFRDTLLFSRVGDIKVGLLNKELATISPNIIAVVLKNTLYAKFLILYFQTKYGKLQIERQLKVSAQPTISTGIIAKLKFPVVSLNFCNMINGIFNISEKYVFDSQSLYTEAEALLLSHLGLDNYTPNPSGIAIKSLQNSFGLSGRLDSEYYQPKYEEIEKAISTHNQEKLGVIVKIKKSIEPGSDYYGDTGVPFVRVSNLSKYEISEPNIKIPINTVLNIQALYPKKDTILLSKDGSVGIAHKVAQDITCVTSGAILHLTITNNTKVLPDYLTLVLNSVVVQMQAERDAGGSIIQHWKPTEIENVIIPILDMSIQTQIADKIKKSFDLRKKANELLELAKKAVEMAIEEGEDKAMQILKEVV